MYEQKYRIVRRILYGKITDKGKLDCSFRELEMLNRLVKD